MKDAQITKKQIKDRKYSLNMRYVIGLFFAVILIAGAFIIAENTSGAGKKSTLVMWGQDGSFYVNTTESPYINTYVYEGTKRVKENYRAVVHETADGEIHYTTAKEDIQIAENSSVKAVSEDGEQVVYADAEKKLHLWKSGKDQILALPEENVEYFEAILSANGRYLAVTASADPESADVNLYLCDLKKGSAEKLQKGTAVSHISYVGNKGDILYRSENWTKLYYMKDGKSTKIADSIKNMLVYHDLAKVVYVQGNGEMYVKDIDGKDNAQLIDTGVLDLYSIGDLYSNLDMTFRDLYYRKTYFNDYTVQRYSDDILDTAVEGILYTKNGATWYTDLKNPKALFIAPETPATSELKFVSEDQAYYIDHGYNRTIYRLEKESDGWIARFISNQVKYDFQVFNNGASLLYTGENDELYVYTEGKEIMLSEDVSEAFGAADGEQILYWCREKLYYLEDYRAEPVLVANDIYFSYTDTEPCVYYWNDAIYYMSGNDEVVKVSTDGKDREVLLEEASHFRILWWE